MILIDRFCYTTYLVIFLYIFTNDLFFSEIFVTLQKICLKHKILLMFSYGF